MIRTFGDDATKDPFNGVRSARARRFPPDIIARARRVLDHVHQAASLDDLRAFPSYRLEKLKGGLADFWSVRVNDQWRVVFKWDGGARDVSIVDYH